MKVTEIFKYPQTTPTPPDGFVIDSVQCVTESTDYDPYGTLGNAIDDYAHYPHSHRWEKAGLEAYAVPQNWDGDHQHGRTSIWDRMSGKWSEWLNI